MSPVVQMIWTCKKCGKKYSLEMYTVQPTRLNKGFSRVLWPICHNGKCRSIEFLAKIESTE